jgi:hypothetical protein
MSMRVTQVRIFRQDDLPWAQILSGAIHPRLAQVLELKPVLPPQPVPGLPVGLIFMAGQFKLADKVIVVEHLLFDERRIILTVVGDSKESNKAFDLLRELLAEIDPRQDKSAYEPLILSEETTTVAELDFGITRMLKGSQLEIFEKDLPRRVETLGAKALPFLSSIRFHIHYDELPESLKQQSITLLDKDVVIEWRQQTSLADNTFFISSPNSSDAHLELIRQLEKAFAN